MKTESQSGHSLGLKHSTAQPEKGEEWSQGMNMCTYMCIDEWICICLYIAVQMSIHARAYYFMYCTCVYIYVHTCVYVFVSCVCVYLCMCVQMCLHGNALSLRSWTRGSLEDQEKEARMLVY